MKIQAFLVGGAEIVNISPFFSVWGTITNLHQRQSCEKRPSFCMIVQMNPLVIL